MASSLMAVLTLHIRADVHLNILDKRDVHLDISLGRVSILICRLEQSHTKHASDYLSEYYNAYNA